MNQIAKQIEINGKIHNLPWLKLSQNNLKFYAIALQKFYAVESNKINLVEGK